MMVKNILPAGIKGIVTIGFICALVASLAAFFNSCATLFTEDFYKPMKKGMSEAHYVLVGRIATVVVVLLGLLWLPVMMGMGNLYSYLQGIQSLLAPAMVAVFTLGIFSKKITPKAGEWGLIGGFLIGMIRLITNVITDSGKAVMDGAFWDATAWFWQTNWLIFECWLLVFIILLMVVRELLHTRSLEGSGGGHHLLLGLQEEHPRELERMGHRRHTGCRRSLRLLLLVLLVNLMTYYSEHSKVWVSVDCIIFGFDEGKLKVLIGRRQMDPGRGEWSLYGGFVAADERLTMLRNR